MINNFWSKFYIVLLFGLLLVLPKPSLAASEPKLKVYLFTADGCPHCKEEKKYFAEMLQAEPYKSQVELATYEVTTSRTNLEILKSIAGRLNFSVQSVPVTVIGERYFIGFDNAEGRGAVLKATIDDYLAKGQLIDPYADLLAGQTSAPKTVVPADNLQVKAPWGQINLRELSLPALAIILGWLDGFNPCAMWVLLFLISLLLPMKAKKKMWILGSTFILASAFVYLLFMLAWLNLILFLGWIFWVRLAIGLVALGGGIWNVRKFWRDRDGGCEVGEAVERRKVFTRIKDIIFKEKFWLSIVGIMALAFTVNLVEMVCSAGLPAMFVQVLALNKLTAWQYGLYLGLYLFFFIINEVIIFIAAMFTMKLTAISTRYGRWTGLIGGILMVIIGLLMIFKHQWLTLG
jgi:glutaredoxin